MTNALATMRVDYDQVINIKNIDKSNNALLIGVFIAIIHKSIS